MIILHRAIILLKPKQTVRIKLIKKFRYLLFFSAETLIWNLFLDDYKIFGNTKVREVLLCKRKKTCLKTL